MQVRNQGFTFVELIVVLVIIAILATIWFTVYESYISTGRDSKRLVELKEVQTLFQEYTIQSTLPLPWNILSLSASGALYAYQGDLSDEVMEQIGFKGSVYDAEYDEFPVYLLSKNKKDFQFLTFIEDPANIIWSISSQTYAEPQYDLLYPKTFGKQLGVVLQKEDQKPLHRVTSWSYDIISGTWEVEIYLNDTYQLDSESDNLLEVLPNNSCKRILEISGSQWNGLYTIFPNGVTALQVYCDMEIDGGGWTLVWRSATGSTGNFSWSVSTGSVSNTSWAYSINLTQNFIPFSDILIARNAWKNNIDIALKIPNEKRLNFQSLTGATYQTSRQDTMLATWVKNTEVTWNQKFPFTFFWNTTQTSRYWFQHTATPSGTFGLNSNGFVTWGYNSSYGSWHLRQGMIFIR
jgi:prepilin-type N-terminal cleavage/methylation domain-containing protein